MQLDGLQPKNGKREQECSAGCFPVRLQDEITDKGKRMEKWKEGRRPSEFIHFLRGQILKKTA